MNSYKYEGPENYYTNDRKEMVQFVPNDVSKVLEIGCGVGKFGKLLKKETNCEVWGVEKNKTAAKEASKELDKVLQGDIESDLIDFPDKYFDCVVFNDLLEHLYDPWKAIVKVKKWLSDDGYIVASIPNVRYFENLYSLVIGMDWKYQSWGILDQTHLRFFTKKSIERMFKECGYEIIQITGINKWYNTPKFKLLCLFFKKIFEDTAYLQFAVVAKNGNQEHS